MTNRVAATYVTYEGREYLVSTIDRPCSAAASYGLIYAETMVWPVNEKRERTQENFLYQCEDSAGSVRAHCQIVLKIAAGQLDFQILAKEEGR